MPKYKVWVRKFDCDDYGGTEFRFLDWEQVLTLVMFAKNQSLVFSITQEEPSPFLTNKDEDL